MDTTFAASCVSRQAASPEIRPGSLPADDRARQSREIVAHLHKSEIYRAYEDAFQATTGLPLALRAVGTFQSPLRDARNANPFCALMAATNKTCAACLRLQQEVEESSSKAARTLECYAGLAESAVPIQVGENVVAFLQTGQVLLRRPSAAQFRRTLRQLAEWGHPVSRAELEKAYVNTRVMTRPQYDSILRLLTIFAEHLSTLTNQLIVSQAAAELPAVSKARIFIAEHQTEEISLGDVARAVNMSAFYFCKTFRKVTGVTFVDYLARLRVESVKNILLDPHKRISEAAFEAGFQSLSQFNRVFRRIAGEAPTVYRERLHGAGPGTGSSREHRAAVYAA
jgi:AraC-like DNA-binding protein/ligand-binding sensor protein